MKDIIREREEERDEERERERKREREKKQRERESERGEDNTIYWAEKKAERAKKGNLNKIKRNVQENRTQLH